MRPSSSDMVASLSVCHLAQTQLVEAHSQLSLSRPGTRIRYPVDVFSHVRNFLPPKLLDFGAKTNSELISGPNEINNKGTIPTAIVYLIFCVLSRKGHPLGSCLRRQALVPRGSCGPIVECIRVCEIDVQNIEIGINSSGVPNRNRPDKPPLDGFWRSPLECFFVPKIESLD